ncbi:hypothetical protein IJF81_00765, partial [bacterium]|nr:hypothetical protein [bacterium]
MNKTDTENTTKSKQRKNPASSPFEGLNGADNSLIKMISRPVKKHDIRGISAPITKSPADIVAKINVFNNSSRGANKLYSGYIENTIS